MKQELICISCPLGCQIEVEYEKDKILSVKGNSCKRGEAYAQQEVFNPERIVTSTVKVEGASIPLLPVKTDGPVPKDMTFKVMDEIVKTKVKAPIKVGDPIIKNILGFGVNLVATRTLIKSK